jgi:hypothetical protein
LLILCTKVNQIKLTPAGQRCAVAAAQSSAPVKLNAAFAVLQLRHNPLLTLAHAHQTKKQSGSLARY